MPFIYDMTKTIQWSALNRPVFADTNVISPLFYDMSSSVPNQANIQAFQPYSVAISKMFSSGLILHIPSIVLLEMCNVFIKWDKSIYNYNKPKGQKIDNPKDYRELSTEKASRKQRYSLIFQQINNAKEIALHDVMVKTDEAINYVNSTDLHSMDTNDYIISQYVASQGGILLTNDHDFASSETKCDIITVNPLLIAGAIQAGFQPVKEDA